MTDDFQPIYNSLIILCWLTFVAYWLISARGRKKVIQRSNPRRRYIALLLIVLVIAYTYQPYYHIRLIPHLDWLEILGVILCALGISISIWARHHLGKNWSGTPSIQQDHELVTSGPYRLVRHPIYTGLLLAMLGSSLVNDSAWIIIFAINCFVFVRRVFVEEKIMMQLFPHQYREYKKRTKALIPFVW